MSFIIKDKLFSKKWFIAYGLIIIGAFILAAGFVFFITPLSNSSRRSLWNIDRIALYIWYTGGYGGTCF